jgi:hypothetical protein
LSAPGNAIELSFRLRQAGHFHELNNFFNNRFCDQQKLLGHSRNREFLGPRKDRAVAPDRRGLACLFERRFAVPPETAAGYITIVRGDASDPIGVATVTLLRDLIANEKDRLILYQTARRQYRSAAAEWAAAHPVPKRDETIWLRPHRGSRYLADPRPEAAAK